MNNPHKRQSQIHISTSRIMENGTLIVTRQNISFIISHISNIVYFNVHVGNVTVQIPIYIYIYIYRVNVENSYTFA